jgi:uncharacterized protein YjiS (DUF1127 family)
MTQPLVNATAAKRPASLPSISIGRVKRSYSITASAADTSASNESVFGSASPETRAVPDATQLALLARAQRSAMLGEILATLVGAVAATVRDWRKSWLRARDERETYRALSALDARTLRDLGIDASEVRSVAAELAGGAESTRAYALMKLRFLAI